MRIEQGQQTFIEMSKDEALRLAITLLEQVLARVPHPTMRPATLEVWKDGAEEPEQYPHVIRIDVLRAED